MDSGLSKKDTDCRTTRFSRTATRGGCPPESADRGAHFVRRVGLLDNDIQSLYIATDDKVNK